MNEIDAGRWQRGEGRMREQVSSRILSQVFNQKSHLVYLTTHILESLCFPSMQTYLSTNTSSSSSSSSSSASSSSFLFLLEPVVVAAAAVPFFVFLGG